MHIHIHMYVCHSTYHTHMYIHIHTYTQKDNACMHYYIYVRMYVVEGNTSEGAVISTSQVTEGDIYVYTCTPGCVHTHIHTYMEHACMHIHTQ